MNELNKKDDELAEYKRIKKFKILKNNFSTNTGELTQALKLRRYFIENKYKKEIENL